MIFLTTSVMSYMNSLVFQERLSETVTHIYTYDEGIKDGHHKMIFTESSLILLVFT